MAERGMNGWMNEVGGERVVRTWERSQRECGSGREEQYEKVSSLEVVFFTLGSDFII